MSVANGVGDKIRRLLQDTADDQVRELARDVLRRSTQDAPPEPPPEEDPDPAVSLRSSGDIRRVRPGVYEISFDTPYAVKQHENLRLDHPRGGKPKFLERNVLAATRELPKRLAAGVRAQTTTRSYSRAVVDRKHLRD